MGFDRRQGPSAPAPAQAGELVPGPGKHTLVAAELEAAGGSAVQTSGKQTRVHDELEPAQRKMGMSGAAGRDGPPPSGAGAPLPPDVRARMEAALGASFSAVRVHQDAYAQAIGAQAFTRGTDIVFAPGRFDPSSAQGLELIGHELAHVKQQAEGRVPVTAQIGGAPANDDPSLEREADDLGAKAARGALAQAAADPHAGPQRTAVPAAPASHAPTQAKPDSDADHVMPAGGQPSVEELDEPEAAETPAAAMSAAPIQRAPTGAPGKAANKLLGLEDVYRLYRDYRSTPAETTPPGMREQLAQQLARYGFPSIDEFAAYVAQFEKSFEDGAVRITLDILARYAGKLYQESQRYQDPGVVKDLHGKLGGFRTQFQQFDHNARIWNDHAAQTNRDREVGRLPGNGHIHARPPTPEQTQAGEKAKAAKASAEAQIKDLSKDYPIFAEEDLPVDRRLDKAALARASESQLAGVLQSHIANRAAVVADARGQLESKHELIYKMDKLMPTFYAEMDIQPGSIHDQIIKDKIHDDAIAKLVGGILLAVVAIALTVVSLGAATPAVVAAGASISAAGLSTYMAYDEYKQYTAEHAVADAGFADDPSVVWLVLAIVGAGVDVAAATKAVRTLAPAAKALHAGGELTDFTKAVEALQKSKQLDEKIAAAAENAAAARKAYAAARGELSTALGKAYSFPGPFTDPEVYKSLVKMAAAKIREGSHSLAGFIAELKQARLAAKLGELSPEELARAKQAFDEAEALAKSAESPVELLDDAGEVIGRYQHGSQLEIISKKKLYGGNEIKLDERATTTVTGTLDDTDSIARRGVKLPGSTMMGENPGGINILRSPKWKELQLKYKPLLDSQGETVYWKTVTDEFWDTVNRPWLDEAIARGDHFRFVSDPNNEKSLFVLSKNKRSFVLDNGKKLQSIFGREVEYLKAKGYTFKADGTAVKES
jgi:hypothetical protein